ncbi:MAG: MipA/OmpV family protein [Alphaproteobacteria bacterium]|nr:MipA/OmpV family protein [Alphaproteobacteria bacterium]
MIRRFTFELFGFAALTAGAAALTAGAIMVGPAPASAQDATYGYGPADGGGFGLGVGGMVGVKPKYEGSDEYEAFGFPIVFPKFGGNDLGGRIKVRGADDVRFKLFEAGGFEIGPLAGYAFGRDEEDGDLLRGLGDVDDGLVLGAYAGYHVGPVLFDVSYHQIVTGNDDGYQIRFGAEVQRAFSASWRGTARVGTTFADDNYTDSYFGITRAQSLGSAARLAAYDADAGIKDVHLELGLTWDVSDRWQLKSGVRYGRLVGDAADSPIVESEDQFSALFGATYTFDVQR